MKRVLTGFLLLVMIGLWMGCTGEPATEAGQKTLYVCPTGESVTNPSLCPKATSAPTTAAPATAAPMTTSAPTTSPPATPPPTTAAPQTTAPPTTAPPAPKPTLEIVEKTELQGPGGEFWIGGKIRNNGDKELFYVQASLTLFNKYGEVLDTKKSAPIDSIAPGATAEFNVIKSNILAVNVASYNLTAQAGQ